MERTPPESQVLTASGGVDASVTENYCTVCGDKILEEQDIVTLSECNHVFHRICLENHLSNSPECPSCKRHCSLAEIRKDKVKHANSNRGKPRGAMAKAYNTRSQVRSLFPEKFQYNSTDIENVREEGGEISQLHTPRNSPFRNQNSDTQKRPYKAPQTTVDYDHISRIVENTVSKMLQNLNLTSSSAEPSDNAPQNYVTNRDSVLNTQPKNTVPQNNSRNVHLVQVTKADLNNNQNRATHYLMNDQATNDNRPMSASGNLSMRPDKLTTIIRDWNIRFDGSHSGMSVEEFLYRVKTLTKENLNNDFSQLCRNLPLLLTGKAQDWYWRYHRQVPQVEWDSFCSALKYQYKVFKSSFDIKEEIRSRKMKLNETFESFYDSIASMLDRLDKPMEEEELIEILTRNLRPDIRHELLYVPIFSIAHLRKLVQMREALLAEDQFRKAFPAKIIPSQGHRKIADIEFNEGNHCEVEDTNQVIDAVQHPSRLVKCWNCEEQGHYWEDCESERKIFCYGCGEKNTYKPQCSKCATRKLWKPKN